MFWMWPLRDVLLSFHFFFCSFSLVKLLLCERQQAERAEQQQVAGVSDLSLHPDPFIPRPAAGAGCSERIRIPAWNRERNRPGTERRMDGRGRAEAAWLPVMLAWLLVVRPGLTQVRHPLPVLWVTPVSPPPGRDDLTAAVGPAVSLALQDLKRQPPPLGNYEIHFQLLDSQCDGAKGLKALFDAMWAGPKYLLVFGGACPSVTALIARSLPALNLVQVSFVAPPPRPAGRRRFPNLFSTAPSDAAVNQAAVKLLQRYGWSRVGVLTQEGPRLSEMKKDLIRQLLRAGVQVAAAESLSDPCSELRRLKDRDVRIIIGLFEEDSASEVFCCAYRLNLFGARFQWIVAGGGGAASGRRAELQRSGCAADSLLTAADGAFSLQTRQSSRNTTGVSGRTPEEYEAAYSSQLTQQGSKVSRLHGFAYDAVWVAAGALSRATEAAKHREKYDRRPNVSVTQEELQRILLDELRKTQFEGVTGPVLFRNGERVTTIQLSQFQGSGDVSVGQFSSFTQQLRLQSHLVKFKGSGPAADRPVVRLQRRRVGLPLYAVVSSLAAFAVFLTLIVLFLHVWNRKHWLLRDGRPRDELLLLGLLLSSSSVPLSGLDGASLSDPTFDLLCSVRLWFLSVGHSVGFAVLFAKTWRVYSSSRRAGTKTQPGRLVAAMFLLDVFVLTSWQILDPLRRVVSEHSLESAGAERDVRPFSEHCSSSNMELWLTAVFGYKGPLLGLGCFLAWSIRAGQEVHPAAHRKHLALSMGAVALCSGLGGAGALLTSHNPPVQFCLSGLAVLCCNTFVLVWLFGPKLLLVRASSELQPPELQSDAQQLSRSEEPSRTRTEQLISLNQQLRRRTAQLDAEIETVTTQLQEIGSEDRNSEIKSSRPEDINSPEHVRRRLSLQLPILHHAYLPVVGGVASSRSSLFLSHDSNC
ncbi:gamma-aminobutyric acid type B receptor subunit 2-like [Centroberyx affinis]|uniref:gamma-aminobutyric acid type B receptor subunit 2-like n=1 Tax=Centroberyx affinis TaxID=166261 RepID=UPI003A5C13A5